MIKESGHIHDISSLTDQCIVVIRSAGERTSQWCLQKAKATFGVENVVLIDERPMHKAIKRAFEIGIESDKTWLVEIDADMLLHQEGILQLLQTASQRPANSFFHFGMVYDKLTNSFRSAGNKIIRTAHLPKALDLVPDTAGQLRPDTFVRKEMARKGFHYYRDICLVGIHDFEQDYFDLYRKGYLQGVKNRNKLERFMNNWPTDWKLDPDYVAVAGGMTAGKHHEHSLPLHPEYYIDKFKTWKNKVGFTATKTVLDIDVTLADDILSSILTDQKLQDFQRLCVGNKSRYHVRSDINWQYRLMKLGHRLSQSNVVRRFITTKNI
ncbi:MAG: hypothetical protein AAFO69_15660 [Bacteroidota bacterium]